MKKKTKKLKVILYLIKREKISKIKKINIIIFINYNFIYNAKLY